MHAFDRRLEFLAGEHAQAEARFGPPCSATIISNAALCQAALAIQRDPLLLDIAQHNLGAQAKLITTRVWWSFPTGQACDADKNRASLGFHMGTEPLRTPRLMMESASVSRRPRAGVSMASRSLLISQKS
ncbi:hypothetical protein BAE42_15600 [Mesorhizobium loti]|nr:hypothetical protein BAE42_15600 [Mesorhizobium loti]OBQ62473.1 hypothetical protein A8146_15100 [Mesorhizobium loti]